MQSSAVWGYYMQKFWVKERFLESYNPQHNPEEREDVGTQNGKLTRLMIDSGCDTREFFSDEFHVSDVHKHTVSEKLGMGNVN